MTVCTRRRLHKYKIIGRESSSPPYEGGDSGEVMVPLTFKFYPTQPSPWKGEGLFVNLLRALSGSSWFRPSVRRPLQKSLKGRGSHPHTSPLPSRERGCLRSLLPWWEKVRMRGVHESSFVREWLKPLVCGPNPGYAKLSSARRTQSPQPLFKKRGILDPRYANVSRSRRLS